MALKSADIVKILGRPPKTSLDYWLETFEASPGDVPTLTATECYRLYQKWYDVSPHGEDKRLLSPEEFGHTLKELGYKKKHRAIRGTRRDCYTLNEAAAHKLLAAHRLDPTPKGYKIKFDITKYRDMGLLPPLLDDDSPLNPWPPGYWSK
jgi:hypothetical protein